MGGKAGGVEEVAYGVVGPAIADGDGMRDFFRIYDDFVTLDIGRSPVPNPVGSGDLEAGHLSPLGTLHDIISKGLGSVTGPGQRA